jgi:hypothetical protein
MELETLSASPHLPLAGRTWHLDVPVFRGPVAVASQGLFPQPLWMKDSGLPPESRYSIVIVNIYVAYRSVKWNHRLLAQPLLTS